MRILALAYAVFALSGCSGQNLNVGTIQLSGEELPFPGNYETVARSAIAGRPMAAPLQISNPQTVVGVTVFSPKRWYSCILGIKPKKPYPGPRYLTDIAGGLIDPAAHAGVFNIVLIFDDQGRASVKEGFDSPLCRNQTFHTLSR